jgi:hypothetical protein
VGMPWYILRKHGQLLLGTGSFLWQKVESSQSPDSVAGRCMQLQLQMLFENAVKLCSILARYKSQLWSWWVVGDGEAHQ